MIQSTVKIGIKKPQHLARFSKIVTLSSNKSTSDSQPILSEDTTSSTSGERDLVNFPRPQRADFPGQVKFGFIPKEWFDSLHPKLGTTGPYVIALGSATFLLSKEIYVLEHNFFTGISTAIMSTYGIKTFGPQIAKYADKHVEKTENQFKEAQQHVIKQYEEAVIHEKKEQWRAEGQMLLFEAKRLTIAYQLEAEYRERVMEAYRKVKQRLEWEVEQERVLHNLSHKHMVQWIRSEVKQSVVSSTFDKKFLKQCIEELNSMAPHAKPTIKPGGSTSRVVLSQKGSLIMPLLL